MYMSEPLARGRSSVLHKEAQEAQRARIARRAAELRKLERIRQRAERKLLRAWQRTDELRATIETAG